MDNRRTFGRWCALLAGGLLALLSSGCSTTAMKGTPFFTGEYETRTGPPEDRVNLWPLLYYSEPALSVLWPIGEYTDNRLAIRPFFSVEDLEAEKRIYNVLWPLGRFDHQHDDYRFFPVYWGDDYTVAFPLYWHFGEPFGAEKDGSDALWPLWCYFRDGHEYSLHLAWPFFNLKSYDDERGGRLWPLFGRYEAPRAKRGRTYAPWPLGWHTWSPDSESWTLLPLFHDYRSDDGHTFGTLLGGWRYEAAEETTSWFALPILGWGSHAPEASRTTALLGLTGSSRTEEARRSYLFPLYYHRESEDGSLFLSPLYASGSAVDDSHWRLLLPIGMQRETPTSHSLYSLLYSRGRNARTEREWECLLPLYYRDRDPEGHTFVTPLGGWWEGTDRRSWAAFPLLTGVHRGDDHGDLWILGPIGHASWDREGISHWLLPVYGYDHRRDLLLSLPYCSWQQDETRRRLSPLLLSAYASRPERWDFWSLAGLLHASGGPAKGSSHLFPLYYSNPETHAFLSPLYAGWDAELGRGHALPLLLSGWSHGERGTDIVALLGLMGARWGADTPKRGHLFPLYWYGDEGWLTPLVGHYAEGGTDTRYWLTPIVGTRSGRERGSWVFPLYGHTTDTARERSRGWFMLAGRYSHSAAGSQVNFPLIFRRERWCHGDETLRIDPSARDGWRFKLMLLSETADYRYSRAVPKSTPGLSLNINGRPAQPPSAEPEERVILRRRESRCFPFWSCKADSTLDGEWMRAQRRLLLCLYDSKREVGHTPPTEAEAPHDYTRRRVLFRLVHYEKLNGATSVDVFPGITYDRTAELGKRKFSLLWRFFRYERKPESTKVDLLFIPIRRAQRDLPEG